jgi:hypothetical protein
MRLINTSTLLLEDFTLRDIPPYAILSHTWANDEVTFQDMLASSPDLSLKQGYTKIIETCRLAVEQGLGYAWVDTCCIDKSSSAELTESINSMFGYYAKSSVCFAHLADLCPGMSVHNMDACRWFTRGWTLQELIAPRIMGFYDQSWSCIGSRASLMEVISLATNIPSAAMSSPWMPSAFSIAERMSWASRRRTTREEDIAYCLLGLFDISMSLIYGEGTRAFERLQEEILKRDTDMTIFAWKATPESRPSNMAAPGLNLLASSPSSFSESAGILPLAIHFPEFSITNKGLLVAPDTPLRIAPTAHERFGGITCIYLGRKPMDHRPGVTLIILSLRKLGPNLFCRHKDLPLVEFGMAQAGQDFHCLQNTSSYYIVTLDAAKCLANFRPFRQYAIHVPPTNLCTLARVVPEHLWDSEDRMFLRPKPALGGFFPMVIALLFLVNDAESEDKTIMVVCDNTTGAPRVGTVLSEHVMFADDTLFQEKHLEHSVPWADFQHLGIRINWSAQPDIQMDASGHSIVVAGTPRAPRVSLVKRSDD